ncbi:MAG: HAD family hydrolase [Elusimicrobiota bacterium]|jgi:phosphoglycolate phosphatase|nr:HAD family hydrolase [Elusimicrobiota bacterium]
MKQDEAIIFDLDGTLTDTLNISLLGAQEAAKKAENLELTFDEIISQFGKSETGLFKHYSPLNWQKAAQYYKEFFERVATPQILFPGIKDILDYLKNNNIKTALVTGRAEDTALAILEKTGIKNYFEHIKTGSEFASIKTKCIKEVLQLWGQAPQKTYYLGDIPNDVRDARAAGVNPLSAAWFPTVDKEKLQQESPLHIFDSVELFAAWVKK